MLACSIGSISCNTGSADGDGNTWYVQQLEGWAGASMRSSSFNRVARHGVVTTDNYMGGRALVIRGFVKCPDETAYWAAYNGLLDQTDPADTFLFKVTEDSTTKRVTARRQGEVRIDFEQTPTLVFGLQLICDDPIKYADTETGPTSIAASPGTAVTNSGNADVYPTFTFGGSGAVTLVNDTLAGDPTITLGSVASGDVLDLYERTLVSSGGTNKYNLVDLASTTWWALQPGSNTIYKTGPSVNITFRSGWL